MRKKFRFLTVLAVCVMVLSCFSVTAFACAYDDSFAGIGVLMGVLGAAIGNIFGLGMGAILHMIA